MSVFFGHTVPRIKEELGLPDETVTVILKGHLLVEEHLNRILSIQLRRPAELEKAGLKFSQRLLLVKSLSVEDHPVWSLIGSLNSLRNQLAHSLSQEDRTKRVRNFLDQYVASDPDPKASEIVKAIPEAGAVSRAIGFALGFLAAYEEAILEEERRDR